MSWCGHLQTGGLVLSCKLSMKRSQERRVYSSSWTTHKINFSILSTHTFTNHKSHAQTCKPFIHRVSKNRLFATFCFRLTRPVTLRKAEHEHIFIQLSHNKSHWLQNDAIELKFILKISTLVLTQPDRRARRWPTFLKLSCDQDIPSDCFEFRGMWNIIGKRGDKNK